MVIVKLLDLNLPVDAVLGTVFNSNGKISSVVEASEFGGRNVSLVESTSNRLLRCRLLLGLKEADSASTKTFTFLKSGNTLGSNAEFVDTEITTNSLGAIVSS